jgi:hypothetical protein
MAIAPQALFLAGLWATPAQALTSNGGITFSLDPASESLELSPPPPPSPPPVPPTASPLISPDDVLKSGPTIQFDGSILGLNGSFPFGSYDNLNALSYGLDPISSSLFFSVDRVAVGKTGTDVHTQAQPGAEEASADIFLTQSNGDNKLAVDEEDLDLVPGFFGDDIDALDVDTPLIIDFVYFSVDELSLDNGAFKDAILFSSGSNSFGIFARAAQMGFSSGSDLDALVLIDRDRRGGPAQPFIDEALFSLSSFSPDTFTFTGNSYVPGLLGSLSPADVLYTNFDGTFSLFASAEQLGLLPDDELDALDTAVPGPLPIFGVTTAFAYSRKLRRRQRSTRLNSRS